MKPRINIITLGVRDLARSLKFYEEGLGWEKSSASQGDIAFLKLNGLILALYPEVSLAEDIGISHDRSGYPGLTLAYNAESEEEVDEIISKVRSLNGVILKEPQKVFWGGYSSYFSDPDGFIFEVAYNPFVEMDADGKLIMP